jgi:MFS family permease
MATVSKEIARPRTRSLLRSAWFILAVLLFFSIAAPLNQSKVPPILPVLMASLSLTTARAGLLMSVYAVTGLILALPSGFIFQRAGARLTGLIAGVSIVIGASLGALSHDMNTLLVSRAIEGAGLCFMAVLAPAIIARTFAVNKHGAAMGIWSTWVPVGQVLMLLIAPALALAAGWQAVWWFGAVYAVVATIAYLVFVAPARSPARRASPQADRPEPAAQLAAHPEVTSGAVLRNRNIWLLAAAFGFFNLGVGAFATFLPTYLSTVRGLPLTQAALLAAISTIITIFSCPAGGLLSDRIGSRRRPFVVGLVLTGLLMPLAGSVALGPLIVVLVLLGLVTGLVPTNIFSAAVEATGDVRKGGLAMAMIMLGQNAGMLLGPVIFGGLVETAGWSLAFASLALISLLGALAGWLAHVR